ncbi:glycosyltransferase [Vagococcus fluvialis]|uniref:glycosyltransferase n=1 Tax=Vagococcus fluvialis TaxID=2738 RepID=UPI001D0A3886|nr:glycosyltransferase [Vagococcus fluvialis]UDM70620.1 glycosyltransferase [Vagococcus fluvialis]UDM78040.1 glycosyltransferase [Vagococcus fluvialis]UDM82309.1 glycosyltransferase [Vagococcus fluvialis]
MSKNYLFIGGYFSSEDERLIIENSKSPVQYAANIFQKNLLSGIEKKKEENESLYKVSVPFVGAYPNNYKKLFFKTIEEEYISFFNFFAIKNIFRKRNLITFLRKNYLSDLKKSEKELVVFVYSPHTPFIESAVNLKKIIKNVHICLIVPDLPQFMDLSNKKRVIYSFLKKIDYRRFQSNLKHIDSFVLLTEHMNEVVNPDKKEYVVIEGIVNREKSELIESIETNILMKFNLSKNDYILYTGTLNEKFGILDLVTAFLKISLHTNKKLVIAGKGDSQKIIDNLSKKNDSIIYLSQIDNSIAKVLQRNALYLVNPRKNDEDYTKYSFPSKNMEYLKAGRPVVCYKLDGISKEYNEIFEYITDTLENKLLELFRKDVEELDRIGLQGKIFVLDNKNEEVQCEKIINLVNRS